MEFKDFKIILPDRSLVNQLWHKSSIKWNNEEIWCTEASDLDANKGRRPRNQCPKCDCFFQRKDLVRNITAGSGEDEEIVGWQFRCPNCKVILEVVND